jgi:hypothetical protein
MALTPLHVQSYCTGGSWNYQDRCRYLAGEYTTNGQYVQLCTKLNAGAYEDLKKKDKHTDRSKMKDNCSGYLYLKHKKQGFDVDKK